MFTLATSHERQSDHVPRFTPHTYTDQGMNNMYVVFAYIGYIQKVINKLMILKSLIKNN